MKSFLLQKISSIQQSIISFCVHFPSITTAIFFIVIFLETIFFAHSFFPDYNIATAANTDFMFHMNRFYGLSEAIDNGSYPFFINTHNLDGYGYAVNLFYPDLTLIPFALLIKPLGLATAYKIMLIVFTFLSALFSFYAIKKITSDRLIATVFCLLYTFALYKIVDFAYRGAIAEFLAFTFIPLIVNGFYEVVYRNYKKWYILSIGFGLLIYTHLISSLLVFLLLTIFLVRALVQKKMTWTRLKYLCIAAFVSLLLVLPVILSMLEQFQSNSFYLHSHPLISAIVDRASPPKFVIWGLFDGLSNVWLHLESFGIIIVLSLLPRLVIKGNTKYTRIADFCMLLGFVLLFMITSLFPWGIFPFNKLSIIQFPFRLLLLITFLLAFSGAIYTALFIRRYNYYLLIFGLFAFAITFMIKTTSEVYNGGSLVEVSNDRSVGYGLDINDIIGAEYLPTNVPFIEPTKPDYYYRIAYLTNRGNVITDSNTDQIKQIDAKRENQYFMFEISSDTLQSITLPLLYYKGYRATLNQTDIVVKESKDGLVEITTKEQGKIKVWYDGTDIQRIAYAIALITLLFVIACSIINSVQSRRDKK